MESEEKWITAFEYMLRYDDRTLSKRGRKIRNIDFLNALKRNPKYEKMQVTHLSNTINGGILYVRKAEDFAKVFRDDFNIECSAGDLCGKRKISGNELRQVKTKK